MTEIIKFSSRQYEPDKWSKGISVSCFCNQFCCTIRPQKRSVLALKRLAVKGIRYSVHNFELNWIKLWIEKLGLFIQKCSSSDISDHLSPGRYLLFNFVFWYAWAMLHFKSFFSSTSHLSSLKMNRLQNFTVWAIALIKHRVYKSSNDFFCIIWST